MHGEKGRRSRGGAHQLELCSNLIEGGVTPSYGLIRAVRETVALPLIVLIRPRAGDFVYSAAELKVMSEDIAICRKLGVAGVAFGCLMPHGSIDEDKTLHLKRLCDSLSLLATFHRAFDLCTSPLEAIDLLISNGFDRILTSGQAASAVDGVGQIQSFVQRAAGRVKIVAAGGISADNVAHIYRISSTPHFHGSCRSLLLSPSTHDAAQKWKACPMRGSAASLLPGADQLVADAAKIGRVLSELERVTGNESEGVAK